MTAGPQTADAVVIGGGIMGASAAHFLAKRGFGRVVLLEKGRLAGVSTGHSAAIVRTYYSNPVTLELAKRALHMFENDRDLLGGDCGFRPIGFLLLIGERLRAAGEHILESERRHGLHVERLTVEEVADLAPPLSLDGVSYGILEPRSGYADPTRTTETSWRRPARGGSNPAPASPPRASACTGTGWWRWRPRTGRSRRTSS